MASKKSTTRDGPRTVNRKVTSATARGGSQQRSQAQRKYDEAAQALADMPRIPGSPDAVVELYALASDEVATSIPGGVEIRIPPRPDLTGTEPKPWDCTCGPSHNSAIIDQCPVCHDRRPFDYTPPVPENAPFQSHPVREDWPQPDESPDDYAKRMDEARGRDLPEQGNEVTPGAGVVHVAGYYCPIEFAGPVGSVSVDPALVQQVVDLTNAAARSAAVRSVTIGVKNPQQARLVLRVDFDLGEAGVRTVRDE